MKVNKRLASVLPRELSFVSLSEAISPLSLCFLMHQGKVVGKEERVILINQRK